MQRHITDSQVSVTCIYHPKHISLASISLPNYIFLMKWPQKSLCHLGEEPPCLWLAVCSSVRAVYWRSLPSKPESGKLVGSTALDSRPHRDRNQQKTLMSVNVILRDTHASNLHVKEGEVSLLPRIFIMWGDKIQDLTYAGHVLHNRAPCPVLLALFLPTWLLPFVFCFQV